VSFTLPGQQKTVSSACSVLGVTLSDAWTEVKVAYRRLAHEFHPDKYEEGGADAAYKTARFREIQEAFELLKTFKDDFGRLEDTSSARGEYANTTDDVPEPEHIRIETVVAYIKYERTWYKSLEAYLEIDVEDVAKLKWYPVPTHAHSISEVRVVQGGVVLMTHYAYSGQDISSLRVELAEWRRLEERKNAAKKLQSRFDSSVSIVGTMRDLHRPINTLEHLASEARTAFRSLTSSYKPTTPIQVEKLFDKVDEEVKRLQKGGPEVIIEDLLDGVLYHSDVAANQAVIDDVKSWHIRTNGFIDLIDQSVLRAFYERRITSERIEDLQLTGLRLKLENFVLDELIEELDVVAPATIELEGSKGVTAYRLYYDYFERDGQKVPVATVTLPLRVYEHNAPEHGKSSKFPSLPFGIELRVEILFEERIIFAGTPGEDLGKKVTKFKRSRSRGKALQGAGDDFGYGRYQPIAASPLPPWFKGTRPRW